MIKEAFNKIVNLVTFIDRSMELERQLITTGISKNAFNETMEMFEAKQNTLLEFITESSSNGSVVFAKLVEEELKQRKDINSWSQYFDVIEDSTEGLEDCGYIDEDGFIGQLRFRAEIFKDYYQGRGKDMCKLLDLYATKGAVEDLTYKTEKASEKILQTEISKLAQLKL